MNARQFLREEEISFPVEVKGFPSDYLVDTTEDEVAEAMEEYARIKIEEYRNKLGEL
jgi:hypothetical protein